MDGRGNHDGKCLRNGRVVVMCEDGGVVKFCELADRGVYIVRLYNLNILFRVITDKLLV